MILFTSGIKITNLEYRCLRHVETFPEQWVLNTLAEKIRLRKEALFKEWRPKLFADPNVSTIPANSDDFVRVIMARSEYKSRHERDVIAGIPPYIHNQERFDKQQRSGDMITMFPGGIDVPDDDVACLLAYVEDVEDWILGALLGHINRGKKKIITQYQAALFANPDVVSFPANEAGLLEAITDLPEYKSIPVQHTELVHARTLRRS